MNSAAVSLATKLFAEPPAQSLSGFSTFASFTCEEDSIDLDPRITDVGSEPQGQSIGIACGLVDRLIVPAERRRGGIEGRGVATAVGR